MIWWKYLFPQDAYVVSLSKKIFDGFYSIGNQNEKWATQFGKLLQISNGMFAPIVNSQPSSQWSWRVKLIISVPQTGSGSKPEVVVKGQTNY